MFCRIILVTVATVLASPNASRLCADDPQNKLQIDMGFQRLRALQVNRKAIEKELRDLTQRFSKDHPDVKSKRSQLRQLNSKYSQQAVKLREMGQHNADIEIIRANIESARQVLVQLTQRQLELQAEKDRIAAASGQVAERILEMRTAIAEKTGQLRSLELMIHEKTGKRKPNNRKDGTTDEIRQLTERVDRLEAKIDKVLDALLPKDAKQE